MGEAVAEVWRRSPQHLKILYFFGKNSFNLGLFCEKLMQLKRGIEINSAKTCLYYQHKRAMWKVAIARISVLIFTTW